MAADSTCLRASLEAQLDKRHDIQVEDDPDVVILPTFEDAPLLRLDPSEPSPRKRTKHLRPIRRVNMATPPGGCNASLTHRDNPKQTSEDISLVMHFRELVAQRFTYRGTGVSSCSLSDQVVAEAMSYPPVRSV